ncbi:Uncharacterised protein [Mycobacteroides abscessus subsp. abscessus]|uniref:Uncharacterized protein n=2 Tax=Mycobacteroides abscessus TaxID=36809 RepID=A0AB33T5R2_9MYCO|nr:Uncharacterised protein [Mycobacteroides abscessus]SHT64450.1 Uncharacterised protein [Mycobacteroides abscessus subsp. abscessus]SKK82154.1 Uncharacterised protein [Mycobacteroides abscessus subsp. massiliense]CPT52456.1 Uncharacterised protein [Mycobacteroides abscessus]CPT59008.1 Uncharacterised protein [Mycobacteroides abscessus]
MQNYVLMERSAHAEPTRMKVDQAHLDRFVRHTENGDKMAENRCPHGYVCDYVYRKQLIDGQEYAVGGDYWHHEDERCDSAQRAGGIS